MKTVSVVIPAYNEEQRIVQTIRSVKKISGVDRIIIVNDGSSDQTAMLSRAEGVLVIDLVKNKGKGGAMNASLPYIDTDVVAFLDADLGSSACEAGKIIQPVLNGTVDLCIASFPPPKKKGGFGIVKRTAVWALRRAGMSEVNAPLSGQRAMTREVLQAVTPFHEAYGVELGMSIKALARGYKIAEIPTMMGHNETGRDMQGFLHRGKQLLDVLRVIIIGTGGNKI